MPMESVPASTESGSFTDTVPTEALLEVVSDLTGYPSDTLNLDMDLESDLGIDSIKRVEILSAMEERMPDLPQVTPDMVGTLKTLGQICTYLSSTQDMPIMEPVDSAVMVSPSAPQKAPTSDAVPRQIIDVVNCPKMPGRRLRIESGRWIGVLDDDSTMAQSIVSQLEKKQLDARVITTNQLSDASIFSGAAGLIICAGEIGRASCRERV